MRQKKSNMIEPDVGENGQECKEVKQRREGVKERGEWLFHYKSVSQAPLRPGLSGSLCVHAHVMGRLCILPFCALFLTWVVFLCAGMSEWCVRVAVSQRCDARVIFLTRWQGWVPVEGHTSSSSSDQVGSECACAWARVWVWVCSVCVTYRARIETESQN